MGARDVVWKTHTPRSETVREFYGYERVVSDCPGTTRVFQYRDPEDTVDDLTRVCPDAGPGFVDLFCYEGPIEGGAYPDLLNRCVEAAWWDRSRFAAAAWRKDRDGLQRTFAWLNVTVPPSIVRALLRPEGTITDFDALGCGGITVRSEDVEHNLGLCPYHPDGVGRLSARVRRAWRLDTDMLVTSVFEAAIDPATR